LTAGSVTNQFAIAAAVGVPQGQLPTGGVVGGGVVGGGVVGGGVVGGGVVGGVTGGGAGGRGGGEEGEAGVGGVAGADPVDAAAVDDAESWSVLGGAVWEWTRAGTSSCAMRRAVHERETLSRRGGLAIFITGFD